MPEWSAEVMVDEKLARRLVDEQFPQLGLSSIRLLGEGWDNTAWLVDGEWMFRFPRRSVYGHDSRMEALGREAVAGLDRTCS